MIDSSEPAALKDRALIFEVKGNSLDDGPGIRTVVFFKGCPLNCVWCHNPESIPRRPVLRYFESRCVYCGACEAACPHGAHQVRGRSHTINRDKCRSCGACVSVCPTGALTGFVKPQSVEDAAREQESIDFYAQFSTGH